jgi:hypothetical protein
MAFARESACLLYRLTFIRLSDHYGYRYGKRCAMAVHRPDAE